MDAPDGADEPFSASLDVVQEFDNAGRPERLPRAVRRHQHPKDRAPSPEREPAPVAQEEAKPVEKRKWDLNTDYSYKPIGFIDSCFPTKNGTPRQPIIAKHSRARLTVNFGVPNPQFAFEGLEAFSHVWLIFLFHDNKSSTLHLKVNPPRLEGTKMGLFATRTPHRPNPFGLSVAKLDMIEGNVLHLSGIDLIHGTPVLDIKPYIPEYDSLPAAVSPDWIRRPPREKMRSISWTPAAEEHLRKLLPLLRFYDDLKDIRAAIEEVACEDPRSTHWKSGKYGELYGFCIDVLNVVLKFHDESTSCTVIDVEDWSNGKGAAPEAGKQNTQSEQQAPAQMPDGLLHERVRTGEVGAVHWALQAYPHALNSLDAAHRTPLHLAASLGLADICTFLLSHGADPSVTDDNKNTPLLSAAQAGHLSAVQGLFAASNVQAVNSDSVSVLHLLMKVPVSAGSQQASQLAMIVRNAAEKGVDVNALDASGLAPLHHAALNRNFCGASALLAQRNVDVKRSAKSGEIPYEIAVRQQDTPMSELLALHGGKPRTPDASRRVTGDTPSVRGPSSSAPPAASAVPSLGASPPRDVHLPVVPASAPSPKRDHPSPTSRMSDSNNTVPRASSPPRLEGAAQGWARAMSPQKRYEEERKESERRAVVLEQLLKQQDELIAEKEAQIAAHERLQSTLPTHDREAAQRTLADMHRQLAELRFAKFKTQKAVKTERNVARPSHAAADADPAASASPSPPPCNSPITSVAPPPGSSTPPPGGSERFRGVPTLPAEPSPSVRVAPPAKGESDTSGVTWRDLLTAAGIDDAVAASYQQLWGHIPIPVNRHGIPFNDLKAYDGVKLGHIHKLMKHLGVPPVKLT